jgi:hypothetical protein
VCEDGPDQIQIVVVVSVCKQRIIGNAIHDPVSIEMGLDVVLALKKGCADWIGWQRRKNKRGQNR